MIILQFKAYDHASKTQSVNDNQQNTRR